MEDKKLPPSSSTASDDVSNSLEASGSDVPVSSFALAQQEFAVETLEVQPEGGRPRVSEDLTGRAMPFSRRRATIVSFAITMIVVMITGVSLAYVIKKNASDKNTVERDIPTQEISVGENVDSDLPFEFQGGEESLLVSGDIITRGSLKVTSGNFVSVIRTEGLTSDREFLIPDASGTLCLDANNCNYADADEVAQQSATQTQQAAQIAQIQAQLGQLVIPDAFEGVEALNGQSGTVSIQGTTNRITVSTANGTITISTPQDLAAISSPTFAGLLLNGDLTVTGNINTALDCTGNLNGGALTTNGAGQVVCSNDEGGGGGGAPVDATYLVASLNAALTDERALTAGSNVQFTDGGAGGSFTIATVQNPTFTTSVTTPLLSSVGAMNITPGGALTVGAVGQTVLLQGSTATITSSAGNDIILSSSDTIELQDNTNITGSLGVSGTGSFSGASVTIGTAAQLGSLVLNDGSSNTGTIRVAALGQNSIYTLPDPVAAGDTICLLSLNNCAGTPQNTFLTHNTPNGSDPAADTSSDTLNYTDGSNVTITGDSGTDTITIATVQNPTFTTSVTTPLLTSTGALSITPGGALTVGATTQTALLQGSTMSITSTGAGNDITLTSADQIILNAGGTIELQDSTNVTGNLNATGTGTFQGASVTIGAAAQQGTLILHDGDGETVSITIDDVAANSTIRVPDTVGASDTLCLLTLNNCAGTPQNTFATFDTPNGTDPAADTAADTLLLVDGTNIVITGSSAADSITVATVSNPTFSTSVTTPLLTSTGALDITPGGALTIGAVGQTALLQGSATSITSNGAGNDITLTSADEILLVTNGATQLQVQGDGDVIFNPSGGGAGFGVSDTTPNYLFTVGSGDKFGVNSAGNLFFEGATNDAFELSVVVADPLDDRTYTIPDSTGNATDTFCLQTLNNCAGTPQNTFATFDAPNGTDPAADSATDTLLLVDGTNITITGSSAADSITVATVANPTFTTSVTTPLLTSTGALAITPGGALSVGATTQTALLQGSTMSITSTGAGNDITLTSADQIILNASSSIELQDDTNIAGNLGVIGGGAAIQGTVTLGTASGTAGSLVFYDGGSGGSENTITFQTGTQSGDRIISLPTNIAGNDTICLLTAANCVGTGGGITGSGTTNRVAKFTASGTIGDSTITDDGTDVSITGDFTVQGGSVTLGAAAQAGTIVLHDGNGETISFDLPDVTASYVLTLPTAVGSSNQCLKAQDGTGTLFWDDCDGGAGGSSVDSFATISVPGGTNPVADSSTDTLNLSNGSNISITGDSGTDTVTVATVQNPTFTTSVTTPLLTSAAGLQIDSVGTLDITAGGAISVGSTGETLALQGSDLSVTSNGAGSDITLTSADQIILNSTGTIELQDGTNITGTLGVSGLASLNGGLTIQVGDTFTFNGDAFTDLTGNGLQVVSNALTLSLQANKGLEVDSNGLSLIDCADGEILKYETTGGTWGCATDGMGAGGITSLTLAGTSGTPQAIGDGDTITIAAGSNITTTAGATDTITVATVQNPTFTTSVTTPLLENAGLLTIGTTVTGGVDDIVFQTAGAEKIRILEAGDLQFASGATRTISVQTASSGNHGNDLTLLAGTGNGTDRDGGNLILQGGAKTGTGTAGAVVVRQAQAGVAELFGIETFGGNDLFSFSYAGPEDYAVLNIGGSETNSASVIQFNTNNSCNFELINQQSTFHANDSFGIYECFGAQLFDIDLTNGAAIFRNSADSTTAFQVQEDGGNAVLNVDTQNGRVGINTAAPTGDLSFGAGADRTINVLNSTTGSGDDLILQGSNGLASGDTNGGDIILRPGTSNGNGFGGQVIIDQSVLDARMLTLRNIYGDSVIMANYIDSGVNDYTTLELAASEYNRGTIINMGSGNGNVGSPESGISWSFVSDTDGTGSILSDNVRAFHINKGSTDTEVFALEYADGSAVFRNANDTTTAFQIQGNDGSPDTIFNVDTTNKEVEIGDADVAGKLLISDGSSNFVTIDVAAHGADRTYTIPVSSGNDTFCLQTLANCAGGAGDTLQGAYDADVNGGDVSVTTTDNDGSIFWNLHNSAGTDPKFAVNIQGTGNTFELQDGGTAFFTAADGGTVSFKNTVDSTSAFLVENLAGGDLFKIDTTNSRVGINLGASSLDMGTGSEGLLVYGGLTLGAAGGTGQNGIHTFTTAGSTSIATKLSIPYFDSSNLSSGIAIGLNDNGDLNGTGIVVFDERQDASPLNLRPAIAVFSHDEANVFGLSWEGQATTGYLKADAGSNLGIKINTTEVATFTTSAVNLLQDTTASGTLAVNGNATLGDANTDAHVVNGTLTFNGASGSAAEIQAVGGTDLALSVSGAGNVVVEGDSNTGLVARSTITSTSSNDVANIQLTNQTSSGTQGGLVVTNVNDAANAVSEYGILINNAESTANTLTDYLQITATTTDTTADAIDVSDAELFNAINVGQNFIQGDGIRQFSSSSTVWTWEDTSGNDLATLTDAGTTGNMVVTGNFQFNGSGTFGDAAGDSLTINGTAISLPNDLNFDSDTLFIESGANTVSIGTTSSTDVLTVNGGIDIHPSDTQLEFGTSGSKVWSIGPKETNNKFTIDFQGNERFTFSNVGHLGIRCCGTTDYPGAMLHLGAVSDLHNAWGTNGVALRVDASTFTDDSTAGSGTATNAVFNSFARPTLAATNSSVTTTNAATVYIQNSPAAGTNQTITNAYALWVDDGTTRLDHSSTRTTGGTERALQVTMSDTGAVTSGTDTTYGGQISVTRTGGSTANFNTYGLDISVTGDIGGASTVTGLNVNVSGADNNYAAVFQGGNVGIGTATPGAPLDVNGRIRGNEALELQLPSALSSFFTASGSSFVYNSDGNGSGVFANAGNLILQSRSTADRDIVLVTGSTPSAKLTVAGSTGNVTLTADLAVNGGDITSSGALNITPGGAMILGATSQAATLQGSTATITSNGAGNDIVLTSADAIRLTGFNCTTFANGGALTTDASGNLTCTDDDGGAGGSSEWTDTGTLLHPADSSGAEDVAIGGTTAGGADIFLGADGSAVFNEQGGAVNFRIESDTNANMLFVDGTNNRVGIGSNAPSAALEVTGDIYLTKEGDRTIKLADSTTASTVGGTLNILGANAATGANGGAINITAGSAIDGNQLGGGITITAGDSMGFTVGGNIDIRGGDSLVGGAVRINGGDGFGLQGDILLQNEDVNSSTGIGVSDATSRLHLGGNLTRDAWGLNGINLRVDSATYTDGNTAASGTATNAAINSFGTPTLAATNASVTTTNAATVYIQGAPTAGTNMTISNAYALWIDGGTARFDGTIDATGGTVTNSTGALSLQSATTSAITMDSGTTGAVNIGTSNNGKTIQIGSTTLNSGTQTINIGNNNTSGGTTNVTIGAGASATGGTTTVQARGALTLTGRAASTWSTSTGLLTVAGGSGLTLQATGNNSFTMQTNGTTRLQTTGGGATTITGGTTGVALTVNNSTSTGNILNLQENGTNVLTVEDGGYTTIGSSDLAGGDFVDLLVGDISTNAAGDRVLFVDKEMNVTTGSVDAPEYGINSTYFHGSVSAGATLAAASLAEPVGNAIAANNSWIEYDVASTGTISGMLQGYRSDLVLTNSGTVNSAAGFAVGTPHVGTTTLTDFYGLYINSIGAEATNGYGIYQTGSADDNYFNGNILLGGTTAGTADTILQANGAAVFNEQGADADFRIESDALANAFFLDASTNNIGINTNTPGFQLHLKGDGTGNDGISIEVSGSTTDYIQIYNGGSDNGTIAFGDDDFIIGHDSGSYDASGTVWASKGVTLHAGNFSNSGGFQFEMDNISGGGGADTVVGGFDNNADFFIERSLNLGAQAFSIGGGSTLTPTSAYVEGNCSVASCAVTMGETGAVEGDVVFIVNVGTGDLTFSDTAGVSELSAAHTLGQYDSLTLMYTGDRWVQMSQANN